MSQTAQNEVSTAIYSILSPNNTPEPGLASIGVQTVCDFRAVPQNQTFPYITIGDALELPKNTLQRRGYLLTYTIHIWSRYRGTQEASAILSRINTLIDQQPLNLPSQAHVYTMYNRALWLADPDGLTLHVATKYTIYTEE